MDNSLKQRLTGAIILVVIAVALVPELLRGPRSEGSAERASADSEAASPGAAGGAGAPLRSYDIDLSDRGAPGTANGLARPPSPGAPATALEPAPAPDFAVPPQAPPPPLPSESSPPRSAGSATTPGYAAQLGSFAARPAADALAAAVQREGFPVFVAPVRSSGQQLWRVRVGPVKTRDEAQALVKRLQASGRSSVVVTHP